MSQTDTNETETVGRYRHPDNRAVCPECDERAVAAVAVEAAYGELFRHPGLECESCGWGSP